MLFGEKPSPQKNVLMAIFEENLGSDSQTQVILIMSILAEQAKTLHAHVFPSTHIN